MHGLRSDVVIVADEARNAAPVVSALSGNFSVHQAPLTDRDPAAIATADLTVFCANPRNDATYAKLRKAAARAGEKLFVLPTHNTEAIDRLKQLGATDYLLHPVDPARLRLLARQALNRRVEAAWADLDPAASAALSASLSSFEDCFSRVQNGEAMPMEAIAAACRRVRDSAQIGTIGGWIDALDGHHNYSFRHSMFVCGTLTYFANAIGIRGDELQLLTVGGLIHDVGKSQVPVAVLDKPGQLDPDEWQQMRRHPEHSREILLREQGLDRDAYEMAVHHHEKLDGTGYPDGLAGSQISDHVRLMSIADVYAALIDKRSYKGAMTKHAALDKMAEFKGHLDMDILRTFRTYMLDTN